MKQRRFPVVPVTLLVVLVGGAVVMSLKPLDAIPQEPKPPAEMLGESRGTITTADLTKVAKEQSNKKPGQQLPDEPVNNEPALLLPAYKEYKPTPNPTATTSRWYDESSGIKPN